MDMLQRRHLQREDRLGLRVEWAAEPLTVTSVDLSAPAIQAWLDAADRDLMASLEAHQRASQTQDPWTSSTLTAVSLNFRGIAHALGEEPDKRTENDYVQEVEAYLRKARGVLADVALARAPEHAQRLELVVVNETERNFADVEFAIHVDGTVIGVGAAGSLDESLPRRPRPFGTPTPSPFASLQVNVPTLPLPLGGTPTRPAPRPVIDNSASVAITWPLFGLRPDGTKRLEPMVLVDLGSPGETLTLAWSATASDATGVPCGTLPLVVADRALQPLDLVRL